MQVTDSPVWKPGPGSKLSGSARTWPPATFPLIALEHWWFAQCCKKPPPPPPMAVASTISMISSLAEEFPYLFFELSSPDMTDKNCLVTSGFVFSWHLVTIIVLYTAVSFSPLKHRPAHHNHEDITRLICTPTLSTTFLVMCMSHMKSIDYGFIWPRSLLVI